jgi:acyl-CoA thioesterase-2
LRGTKESRPGKSEEATTIRGRGPLDTVAELVERLDLEILDKDLMLGDPGSGGGRLFGGLVAAQSVVAAGRSVEGNDSSLHSLHAYFLRPGRHGIPIRFVIDRIRDGRSFTTRRVVAHQGGEAIFNVSASFAKPEEGFSHQEPMPDSVGPEGLPEMSEVKARWFNEPAPSPAVYGALEIRIADGFAISEGEKLEPQRHIWMRLNGPPPEDPLLRTALLVYASDRTLMGTAHRVIGQMPGGDYMGSSLDHAVWIHHPPALDSWFLYSSRCPMAQSGRALIHGAIYEGDGKRVASVTQEGLLRSKR